MSEEKKELKLEELEDVAGGKQLGNPDYHLDKIKTALQEKLSELPQEQGKRPRPFERKKDQ